MRRRNNAMVREGVRIVIEACAAKGIELGLPVAEEQAEAMLGGMIALPLPVPAGGVEKGRFYDDALWDRVYARGVQAPVWDLPGVHPRMMRVSAHLSTRLEDFEALGEVLAEELLKER